MMKGAAFVKKEKLKQKAMEIGSVPTHLKLEIEDYGDDEKRAYFCWIDPQDEHIGIIVELGPDGQLESLSRDMEPESGDSLPEKRLEEIMRGFVETHYPGEISAFVREENDRTYDDKVRFSYVQMEEGLPLPMSGFMADLSLSGEVIYFRYTAKRGASSSQSGSPIMMRHLPSLRRMWSSTFYLRFSIVLFTKTGTISRIWCMSLNAGPLQCLRIWFKKNKNLMMTMAESGKAFLFLYLKTFTKRPIPAA
ncbi:hypothetical protein BSBH6_03605 [Bacillus subtilis]|nr:hypothetical protein BSBH6_03605 [Bacillus subtilis]RPK22344.1 hypothetical protein BH5_03609 [Bacillus subtilis]